LLEAQSSGVAVVAADVGGVAAAVDPHSATLVPAENPAALAAGLQAALAKHGGDPRGFVLAHASLAASTSAYLALAEEAA
jgi:glycosyltransferase involved in cell wall biosynthesis